VLTSSEVVSKVNECLCSFIKHNGMRDITFGIDLEGIMCEMSKSNRTAVTILCTRNWIK